MSDIKILVVDDEPRMRKLLNDFLTHKGYIVIEAKDGMDALARFEECADISLVLLDVMMPKLDGYEVLKKIRETSKKIPVIMLTAKTSEKDELLGFDLGVDEYIAKPFSPKILVARVEAVLRRSGSSTDRVVSAGLISLDKLSREVMVEDVPVELSFKEFELLEYFISHEGEALSREKILAGVWNYDYFGDARTIDTHVKKLRTKLGKCESYIQTCWGVGYKFQVN